MEEDFASLPLHESGNFDFSLVYNDFPYKIDPFLFAAFSKKFRMILKRNRSKEILFKDNQSHEDIDYFISLLQGKSMKLANCKVSKMIELARSWNVPSLTKFLANHVRANDSVYEYFDTLKERIRNKQDTSDIETYVAQNLFAYPINELAELPLGMLKRIISNKEAAIPDNSTCLEFVLTLIRKHGSRAEFFLDQISLESLDSREMHELLLALSELPNSEKLKTIINEAREKSEETPGKSCVCVQTESKELVDQEVQAVQEIIVQKKNKKHILIPYREGNEFNGLFALLNWASGGNAHTKGLIKVTSSSSVFNQPSQVIEMGSQGCWGTSGNLACAWLKFDFKEKRIKLSAYTLKTYDGGGYSNSHLKSWVVQGSNDDTNWDIIDEQHMNYDLNGNNKYMTYTCSARKHFRIIRLMQTRKNHWGTECMWLANVEFFGSFR